MHVNPYLFILPRTPAQIVWNYKDHVQYELDLEHSSRLGELINNPDLFDEQNNIDLQLLDAGILTSQKTDTPPWGWDELSRIFHIGTQNIPSQKNPQTIDEWARQYLQHCNDVLASPAPDTARLPNPLGETIALPTPAIPDPDSLTDVLTRRKTCRSFTGRAVSLVDASTLLYWSFGYLRERDPSGDGIAEGLEARRSSPSGGGLNACECFVLAQHVDGLEPGVYAYHPDRHVLTAVSPSLQSPLGLLLGGQHFINNLPLGLFITARFDKLWWKYQHSRAYRMAFVEAGHLSQTLQMVATALGLGTWLTGAFADAQVEALLKVAGRAEQPLFFVGCGESDGEAMCLEMRELLQRQPCESQP
ncbi:SagB family peptide dehydrogenase [Pseudomonas hamedanensis]|uniref:SagB/ThcOx family dehydrogenase n=1 Tax=Pseudomonas hamedanensis TaxID=2745504 RepID=A0A9E6NY94_9PSED|nr:SagB family peptide dehydrogenase [Pseudomonas hamedanensis]QXI16078.1 SagB/ThcOx family dehydrogenase [Pseudomonas hamedanensis]